MTYVRDNVRAPRRAIPALKLVLFIFVLCRTRVLLQDRSNDRFVLDGVEGACAVDDPATHRHHLHGALEQADLQPTAMEGQLSWLGMRAFLHTIHA